MAGSPIVGSPIAPSVTRGGMTFTALPDGVMLGFEPPPGFNQLKFAQQNGLSNITTHTDSSGKQTVETLLSPEQYNQLVEANPALELPSFPPPNGNTEGEITRLPTVVVTASANTSNPDAETETPEEDSYWWDYLKRSGKVLADEAKGFAGAAVDTVETIGTGLGYLATQPIESGKALIWGAGQVGGMVVEGLGHIVTQPAEVGKALWWGAGEVADSVANTLAGEGAGAAIGGALFNVLPLPKASTLARGAGAEAKVAQEARLAQEARAAEEARRLKAAEEAKAAEDARKGRDSKVEEDKNGKPKGPCKGCPEFSEPVNPILGIKLLEGAQDLDFVIPGVLPLRWQRSYYSDNVTVSWLGQGWSLPLSYRLEILPDGVDFIDTQGRRVAFPSLRIGGAFFSRYEGTTLLRAERNRFELSTQEGLRLVFGLAPSDQQFADAAATLEVSSGDPCPQAANLSLIGMIDANGNWLRVHYTPDDLPQVVELSSGRRIGLVFGRLPEVAPEAARLQQVVELLGEPDAHGRFSASELLVEYRFSREGDLIEVVGADGCAVRGFRWRNHMMVEHSEPGGLVSRYEWDRLDPTGRVVRNSLSTGESIAFAYFDAERRATATDASGRVTTFCFDAERRYTGYIDAEGNHYRFDLDAHGNRLAITDALGRATRYQYDWHGNAVRIQSPDGSAQRHVFDASGKRLLEKVDALDRRTQYQYDDRGNLITVVAADGATTHIQRDERGLPVAVIDPLGNITRHRFNAAGQLLEKHDCLGQPTRYEYDHRGNLLEARDALGQVTRYAYQHINRRDRLIAVHSPDGAVERFAYDGLGRLVAHHDALGQATHYVLDAKGRPLHRENALGHQLRYQYDVHGRLLQLTNENGAHYRFAWDVLDRLVAEQGFDGRRQDHAYNAVGELIESADGVPLSAPLMARERQGILRHRYQRDLVGRLIAKVSSKPGDAVRPDVSYSRFVYDAAGQLIRARNRTARVTLSYTAAGHLAEETTRARGGQTTQLKHEYDAAGNRIATVLPDGRRLSQHRYGSGYVDRISIDDEVLCEFERDALHRETVRNQGALRSFYERDAMGRLLASSARSSLAETRGSGEPSGTRIARQYEYDRAGQLLAVTDARRGRTAYSYDATGRLLAANAPHARETFAFDPASNLIDPEVPRDAAGQAIKRTWTEAEWQAYIAERIHDPDFSPLQTPEETLNDPSRWGENKNNRLFAFQEHRYRYDAWGNCTEKKSGAHETRSFRWDAEHQLVDARITRVEKGRVVAERWGYDYDPFGRRVAKYRLPIEEAANNPDYLSAQKVRHNQAAAARARHAEQTTHFGWDGNRLLMERCAGRQTLHLYEPDSFVPLALVRDVYTLDESRRPEEQLLPALAGFEDKHPVEWATVEQRQRKLQQRLDKQIGIDEELPRVRRKPEVFFVHTDHLGTPREMTDAAGHLVWAATYKAWGAATTEVMSRRVVVADGNLVSEVWEAPVTPAVQNLRFQGQYFDAETGLHYNRFRYYDPDVGRFISQDPIGLAGGTNSFRYAPNPIGWIDPNGLRCLKDLVMEAHALLDAFGQGKKTTAVGADASGNLYIASSDPVVPRAQRLWAEKNGITVVNGVGHAEETLMNAGKGITQIEPSRAICLDCDTQMKASGVDSDAPRSGKKSKNRRGC